MSTETKVRRRDFLKGVTAGGAGLSAALAGAPGALAARNPNDRLGVGIIGVGTRGHTLLQQAQAIPNAEIRVISDLYTGHVQRAQGLCTNPKVRIVKEWEKVVSDPDIDVVIIATPDFWHAPMTIAAAEANKDIYVEKGWCTTLKEAKQMRKAVKDNHVVMQLGHHYNGSPAYHKAREIYQSGALGKVTVVRMFMDRTGDFPFWKFYSDYDISKMPADAGPDTIDWDRFIANAPKRPFDAERFFTWRCWWDYGTGIAGDLMSHPWDGVNLIMGMGIPESVVSQGGTYFWKGDRDVPDMWHVIFDYPQQELAVTFGCSQHSKHVGEITHILGRDKTLMVNDRVCETYLGEWTPAYQQRLEETRTWAAQFGMDPAAVTVPPDYRFQKGELEVTSHMEDFFECVRSRALPRCHVDRAFEEAVAILMTVEAFRQERQVKWDNNKEKIV